MITYSENIKLAVLRPFGVLLALIFILFWIYDGVVYDFVG